MYASVCLKMSLWKKKCQCQWIYVKTQVNEYDEVYEDTVLSWISLGSQTFSKRLRHQFHVQVKWNIHKITGPRKRYSVSVFPYHDDTKSAWWSTERKKHTTPLSKVTVPKGFTLYVKPAGTERKDHTTPLCRMWLYQKVPLLREAGCFMQNIVNGICWAASVHFLAKVNHYCFTPVFFPPTLSPRAESPVTVWIVCHTDVQVLVTSGLEEISKGSRRLVTT